MVECVLGIQRSGLVLVEEFEGGEYVTQKDLVDLVETEGSLGRIQLRETLLEVRERV
jgi:hypothetical protein